MLFDPPGCGTVQRGSSLESSMVSVALTFSVFAIWGIVGYALTSSLLSRRQAISNLLLAPAVGMGTLELVAHIGLRFGSPVGPIALPIVLGALLLALCVL